MPLSYSGGESGNSKNTRRKKAQFFRLVESLETRRLLASTLVITKGGTYTGTWESTGAM